MQISLHSDYALRILMALASEKGRLSVDEIAHRYGISRNHLAKVAQRLQTLKLVETFRGRNGGMQLAKDPSEIVVGEIVRQFERLDSFVGCFPSGTGCTVAGVCGLKPALSGALDAFLTHLDKFRLSDLLPDPAAFQHRLESIS